VQDHGAHASQKQQLRVVESVKDSFAKSKANTKRHATGCARSYCKACLPCLGNVLKVFPHFCGSDEPENRELESFFNERRHPVVGVEDETAYQLERKPGDYYKQEAGHKTEDQLNTKRAVAGYAQECSFFGSRKRPAQAHETDKKKDCAGPHGHHED